MQLFANNADSSLNGAIASDTAVLVLKTGEGDKFPSPTNGDFFLVTLFQRVGVTELNHEVVKCTSRTGDTLTVIRAQEGTAAKAFNSGDLVELRLTAGTLVNKADASDLSTKLDKTGGSLSGALNLAATIDIASATTTAIGAVNSNSVQITGTVSITSLGVAAAGVNRTVTFAGALTLTHNATSLILPGGANITTSVGDVAVFVSLGAGSWRCTGYMRASGQALVVPSQATPYADTPATTTAVPYGHYRLTASLDLTLPASPADGVWVDVVNTSGTTTARVLRNGQSINGLAEDLTLDKQWVALRFIFRTGYGWIIT